MSSEEVLIEAGDPSSATAERFAYSGHYEYNIDGKNRISVPPRFREKFNSGGFLSLRTNHIALYDSQGWAAHLDGLRQRVAEGVLPRPAYNTILGVSEEIAPDGQGRFGLGRLREAHGLDSRVTVVGLDNYLGIFKPEQAPGAVASELQNALKLIDEMPQ